MIYQQAADSQSQALRFDLIQAPCVSERYAVQAFYILTFFFTPKEGLVSSFHSLHEFPVCHTGAPALTISSHNMPVQCASSRQVPHVCCSAPKQGLVHTTRDCGRLFFQLEAHLCHLPHLDAFPPLYVLFVFPSCVFFSFLYFPFFLFF